MSSDDLPYIHRTRSDCHGMRRTISNSAYMASTQRITRSPGRQHRGEKMFRAGVTATSILKKGSVAVVREKSRRSSSRSPCVAARRPSLSRSPPRYVVRSQTERQNAVSDSHRHETSRPFSASTPTPSCARCGCFRTRGCLSFGAVAGSRWPGHPSAAPSCRRFETWSSSLAGRDTPSTAVEMIEDVA